MIAIGLACNPKLLIADEPTTALDVTIQAQILELMKDLSRRLGIAVIIITHNLGIVARYADRVNVMYAARLVESGTAEAVFGRPLHPYARGLLSAVPRLDRGRTIEARHHRRRAAQPAQPAGGLPLPAALPLRLSMPACTCRPSPRSSPATSPPATARPRSRRSTARMRSKRSARSAADTASDRRQPMLDIKHASKFFHVGGGFLRGPEKLVRAVNDVSLTVRAGETLGLVGESGCGKSTLGRLVLRLEDPTAGEIIFDGVDLAPLGAPRDDRRAQEDAGDLPGSLLLAQSAHDRRPDHRRADARAQSPAQGSRSTPRVAELLQLVGLFPYMALRYPHELSGGQRQRVGIARALAVEPRVIVCDEAVSALDVSIQGQVINLLEDLQQKLGLTYLFIAHDLAVVRHISTRSRSCISAASSSLRPPTSCSPTRSIPIPRRCWRRRPIPDPVIERTRPRTIIKGELPSPLNPPSGCVFHPRCPKATEDCKKAVPPQREAGARASGCLHSRLNAWLGRRCAADTTQEHGVTDAQELDMRQLRTAVLTAQRRRYPCRRPGTPKKGGILNFAVVAELPIDRLPRDDDVRDGASRWRRSIRRC